MRGSNTRRTTTSDYGRCWLRIVRARGSRTRRTSGLRGRYWLQTWVWGWRCEQVEFAWGRGPVFGYRSESGWARAHVITLWRRSSITGLRANAAPFAKLNSGALPGWGFQHKQLSESYYRACRVIVSGNNDLYTGMFNVRLTSFQAQNDMLIVLGESDVRPSELFP